MIDVARMLGPFIAGDATLGEYLHHQHHVVVEKKLKGMHREYCLCHHGPGGCENFNPDDQDKHCPIARILFAICTAHGVVTPVWECPYYRIRRQGAH